MTKVQPTREQLKDLQWWNKNVDEAFNYCYTTGPDWIGSKDVAGTFTFANEIGDVAEDSKLVLSDIAWVLHCRRPTILDIEQWPEGATHKIWNAFTKWADGAEYSFSQGAWTECASSWPLDEYKKRGHKIIERPAEPAQYVPEAGDKIDVIFNEVDIDNLYGVIFIAEHGNEYWIKDNKGYSGVYEKGDYKIIKHKSERDVFIERVSEAVCNASIEQLDVKGNVKRIAGILFDAEFKAPEVGEKC